MERHHLDASIRAKTRFLLAAHLTCQSRHIIPYGSVESRKCRPADTPVLGSSVGHAAAGDPADVWMVGDNLVADVAGAEALGLPAILVRSPRRDDVRYYASNLWEAAGIIEACSTRSRGVASAP
ncbi:MAG: HAD hydrolase-like protein [Bacillota bacterium]